jgi:hypothetical protein
VFADDVRDITVEVNISWRSYIGALPFGRLGVLGTLESFLGIGESLREDKADPIRGPALCELLCRYGLVFA